VKVFTNNGTSANYDPLMVSKSNAWSDYGTEFNFSPIFKGDFTIDLLGDSFT